MRSWSTSFLRESDLHTELFNRSCLPHRRCDVRMPDGKNQRLGTAGEVREAFKGWDPRIDRILEFVSDVLEWRVSFDGQMT